MKTLYFIIIFFSIINFSQAEESRWVKNGAFWELPDSISNFQFTPEGDYFFVLDKVNYKFLKYKTETGVLEKTYNISQLDEFYSVPKDKIEIQLSPDCKTYTVSSLFAPIIFFIHLDKDTVITTRTIVPLEKNGYYIDYPYPFKSFNFNNLFIYQDPYYTVRSTTGGLFDATFSSDIYAWKMNLLDSLGQKLYGLGSIGIESFLITKDARILFFVCSKRVAYGRVSTITEDVKDYTFNLFDEKSMKIQKFGSKRIPTNLVQSSNKISSDGISFFDHNSENDRIDIYRTDTVNKFVSIKLANKISNFSYINKNYIATIHRDSVCWMDIYQINAKDYVESIKLGEYDLYSQMLTHPSKSEIYLIKDRTILQKFDLTKYDGLVAFFMTEGNSYYPKQEIAFNNYTTGTATSYLWEFGDGTISTEFDPTHKYETAGKYSIRLTAYNGADSSVYFREKYITILPPIKANFEIQQLTGLDNLPVVTKNLSTGPIISYKWIIGENVFISKEPAFTINKPGYYDVTLIVRDSLFADTITKVDYLNVIQSPIDNEYIDLFTTFKNPIKHFKPANITENITNKYVIGYSLDTINKSLSYNASIFELENNFKESSVIIVDACSSKPDKLFINSDNKAVLSLLQSGYLIYYDFNNNSKIKFEDVHAITELFSINKNCLAIGFERRLVDFELIISKLKEDLSFQQILLKNCELSENEIWGFGNHKYVLENTYLLTFLNYFERKYNSMYKDFDYYKTSSVYIMEYEIKDSIYNVSYSKEHKFSYNYSSKPELDIFINDAKSVKPNTIGFLTNGNNLQLYKKEPQNLKKIAVKSINANCIYPYNDSLFLAGGSINNHATLFFLSTEDLEIKKTITLNSLYGNITSIERCSDGEFLLLAENRINKKFDSFLALKTKNLGKDAYPVSVDLGNDTSKFDFSNLGKYLPSNSLSINYSDELVNPTLEIYDFMGRKLFSTSELMIDAKSKQVTCDLSQFGNEIPERAIYFYILKDSNQILRGKFMR